MVSLGMKNDFARDTRHILWVIQFLRKERELPSSRDVFNAFEKAGYDILFTHVNLVTELMNRALTRPNTARDFLPREWSAPLKNAFIEAVGNIIRNRPVPQTSVDVLIKIAGPKPEPPPKKSKPTWEEKVLEIVNNPFSKQTNDALTWMRVYLLPKERHPNHVETPEEKLFQARMDKDNAFKARVERALWARIRFNRMHELARREKTAMSGDTRTERFARDSGDREIRFGAGRMKVERAHGIAKDIVSRYQNRRRKPL